LEDDYVDDSKDILVEILDENDCDLPSSDDDELETDTVEKNTVVVINDDD